MEINAGNKYDDYVKENGIAIHLTKYKLDDKFHKIYSQPPNELEARNDPLVREAADYQIVWEDSRGDINKLQPHIIKFVDWFGKNQCFENIVR